MEATVQNQPWRASAFTKYLDIAPRAPGHSFAFPSYFPSHLCLNSCSSLIAIMCLFTTDITRSVGTLPGFPIGKAGHLYSSSVLEKSTACINTPPLFFSFQFLMQCQFYPKGENVRVLCFSALLLSIDLKTLLIVGKSGCVLLAWAGIGTPPSGTTSGAPTRNGGTLLSLGGEPATSGEPGERKERWKCVGVVQPA